LRARSNRTIPSPKIIKFKLIKGSRPFSREKFIIIKDYLYAEVQKMCAVGGPPDIGDPESLFPKDYRCLECGHKFKGIGAVWSCPSCNSQKIEGAK
jgi:rubredoxin